MSSITSQITTRFLEELAKAEELSEKQIEALQVLMEKDVKIKPADFEGVFVPPQEPDV